MLPSPSSHGRRQVAVRPYFRTVDGKPEHVSGYTQARESRDRNRAENNPASPEPNASARPAPAGAPAPRPAVIFVGGAADSVYRPVEDYFLEFKKNNPGLDVRFFAHDQIGRIRGLIDSLPAGTRISLVGHSWSADTAAQVAARLGEEGRPIADLVTIDPVGSFTGYNFYNRVAAGAQQWLNVDAVGGDWWESSNLMASLGGRYGSGPRGIAHGFIEAPRKHADFGAMLEGSAFNGMTLADRLRGRQ